MQVHRTMTDRNRKDAWNQEFSRLGDARNRLLAVAILAIGTLAIIPGVILDTGLPGYVTYLRFGVSVIGAVGILLFRARILGSTWMVLSYALPMFALTSFMIAMQTEAVAVVQLTTMVFVVAIFYTAFFILPAWASVVMISAIIFSYVPFVFLFGVHPAGFYMEHSGSLLILTLITLPLATGFRNRMLRENFQLHHEVESQRRELEFYAHNDALTGTMNRRGGMAYLEHLIGISRRHGICLSIGFVDVDGLKTVNDEHGHKAGDDLIRSVAGVIKDRIRDSDSLFRVGGDEFIVLFPGCRKDDADGVFTEINRALKKEEESRAYPMEISYGIAEYDGSASADAFIHEADNLMYGEKQKKKRRKAR